MLGKVGVGSFKTGHTEEAVQILEMKKIQERRAFQAKQTASAKALWQKWAWNIPEDRVS